MAGGLLALVALLLVAIGALWVWAGSDGSLATALRWASEHAPLKAEQVSGSLRAGGTVGRLAWDDQGLHVEVEQAELRWAPQALLSRTLHIQTVSAARVLIDNQRAPGEPSAGPPESAALPLRVRVDALRVGELRWAGPPTQVLHDITAHYAYDGTRHQITLDNARFEASRYHASATLTAHAPLTLDATLGGALSTPVPGTDAQVDLNLQATLRGPLTELQAQAEVHTGGATPGAEEPQAQASARITPWAAQPLPEAHATVRDFDAGAFWPQAPHTMLTGRFDIAPAPTDGTAGTPGMRVSADLNNAAAGPWDQHHLPVDALQADVLWQDGVATVHALQAQLAGGTLQAEGRWASQAQGPWDIGAHLKDINPARLHTQLAALPLDGHASVHGEGAAIRFDAALQAHGSSAATDALTRQWQALRLQDASARGQWADGLLTLEQLQLRTDTAQLAGSARLHLASASEMGASADLSLSLPGASATVHGELQPTRGGGTLQATVSDMARTLVWARTLPGADAVLAGQQARGSADLQARWSGGWRDPEVHARLSMPTLALAPTGGSAGAPALQARNALVQLDGRLSGATLAAHGAIRQDQRALDFDLSAQGGRSTAQASRWHAQVGKLRASVHDPALGEGTWELASEGPFDIDATADGKSDLTLSPGAIAITSPAPTARAKVAWGPLRWSGGELSSTGRITGLPLQWAERLGGFKLADAGMQGNPLFDGHWDVALGRELRLRAELARAEGDLTLAVHDEETGVASRISAGLRQARVQLDSEGPGVTLKAQWDSAEAGTVEARLRTTLSATPTDDGSTHWSWPENAPLQGEVTAKLPRIATWSALAPPGWRLRGTLSANVHASGTRGAPQLHGELSADKLALRSVVDGLQLGRGQLRARLDGTRLIIDELRLHGPGRGDKGGQLNASGEAGWIDGQARARLNVTLDHLRASVRADRQVTVSGEVQAALADRAVSAQGGLHIDSARIVLPDESAPALGDDVVVHDDRAAEPQTAAADAPPESPLTIDARVQLDLGNDLRVSGMGIDTRLAGTLTLSSKGPLATMPQLTGTIRTVDGSFHAYGQNLNITRGNITFSGVPANPALDIIALRPNYASDQQAGVQVAGTALLPRVRLYSQPQLSDTDTLAWLLLGRPAPDTGAEAAMLQSAALALLGGREGRGLASQFGLDELSFNNGAEGGMEGASVMLGKRLSDRLYAAYEHSLAGTTGSLLIFYELSRRWSVRGQAGENAAVDLIYRLSFN